MYHKKTGEVVFEDANGQWWIQEYNSYDPSRCADTIWEPVVATKIDNPLCDMKNPENTKDRTRCVQDTVQDDNTPESPSSVESWEKEFDELEQQLFYFLPELNEDERRASQTIMGKIYNLLQQNTQEVLQGVVEKIKDLGHQQEDDTIWCNMDEVLKALTPKDITDKKI